MLPWCDCLSLNSTSPSVRMELVTLTSKDSYKWLVNSKWKMSGPGLGTIQLTAIVQVLRALIINYSPSLGPQFPHLYNKQVIVPCPVFGCSSEVTAPSSEGGFISSTADSATREMEPSPLHHPGSCQQEVGFCEPSFPENVQNGQACERLPKSTHGYLPAESLDGAWCGLQQ